MLPSKPPAAIRTPRRATHGHRVGAVRRLDTDHPAAVGDQLADGVLGQDGAALAEHDRGQPGDQRLPATQSVATALAGAVALDRGPQQLADLGGQLGALDVDRLDRAAERHPARRVVVLRERQPLELHVRVRLELGDQGRRLGEERVDLLGVRALEDRVEVAARGLRGVRDPGPLLDVTAGQPAGAAGVRRGAADQRRLLQDGDREAGLGGQRRAGQGTAARADHDDVVHSGFGHRRIVASRTRSLQTPMQPRRGTSRRR